MYKFIFVIIFIVFICLTPRSVSAVVDPKAVENNKFGIHILFPNELEDAAKLVNSQGGDWGYVTIPIQAGDKNLVKWQAFMDKARELHVIPIIRIATEGDYFNKKSWRKASFADVLDFAGFLNSLDWPTKNRYVIIFNEVNRGDEWGGEPNPQEYAEILSYAVSVFKERNEDFFIIGGGLDNAAPTRGGEFINQYEYIQRMHTLRPGVFNAIDGWASHSYPNPGFRQPPSSTNNSSIRSFLLETDLIRNLEGKTLPVFITETGWSKDVVSNQQIATYYEEAFSSVWNNENVIAVTPFLLKAGGGPFVPFSFIENGAFTVDYTTIQKMPKNKGKPKILQPVLGEKIENKELPMKNFDGDENSIAESLTSSAHGVKQIFKWLLKI